MKDFNGIFCVVEYRRELRCPRERVFEAARDKNFERKKKWQRRKDRRMNIRNYITADVHASWNEKVQCMCLYSTDTAFTQHKYGKYSLQTKGQKQADKEIFERHVKLQADSQRIRGARDNIRIFTG